MNFGLKIVSTANLILHETNDPKRSLAIQKSIKRRGLFTNPILVTKLPRSSKYIVLDGANRTIALRELDIPYALVQEYDYKSHNIGLQTWLHNIEEKSFAYWQNIFEKLIHLSEVKNVKTISIGDPKACIYIVHGKKIYSGLLGKTLEQRLEILNNFVDSYRGKYVYSRVEDYKNGTSIKNGVLLIFPQFTPKDILQVVKKGLYIPSGISRHVVKRRALHINVPLEILQKKGDIKAKQKWLESHVDTIIAERGFRCYDGSVCLFDE